MNDRAGAIQDLRQAVKLSREQRREPILQAAIDRLRKLGVTD
jgi:hypothetical protein